MAAREYPDTIPEYIEKHREGLQHVAGWWEERESLQRSASLNPERACRLKFWDFFFAKSFESELLRPIDTDISRLSNERADLIRINNTKQMSQDRKRRRQLIVLLMLGYILLVVAISAKGNVDLLTVLAPLANLLNAGDVITDISVSWGSVFLVLSSFCGVSALLLIYRITFLDKTSSSAKQIDSVTNEINEKLRIRQKLQSQLPSKVTINDVAIQLEEDLARQTERAKNDLASTGLEIDDAPAHPPLRTPALLQDPKELSGLIKLRPRLGDHLAAFEIGELGNGRVSPIYCVYRIDLIVPGKDILFTYSSYYDLIEDECISHTSSEQYYKHIVAITITREDQAIGDLVAIDVPCLSIELASGETRAFYFSTSEHFEYRLGSQNIEDAFINANLNDERIVKAIRYYIRSHQLLSD